MPRVSVTVRLDRNQLKRAQKLLRAKTITETFQKALDLVTEKGTHDEVIRRYSGVGRVNAFRED